MNYDLKKDTLLSFLAAVIFTLMCAVNSQAASNNSPDTFEAWLEKYGAWDVLEENYSSSADSPELILKRAQTAYNLGSLSSCLNILQSTPAFDDKNLEIKRLWLGGQAQRTLGNPVKTVIWFSQAARLMDQETMIEKFTAEPYLKSIWFDVWRSLFWGYYVTPDSAREARKMMLEQSFNQAEKVWSSSYFVSNGKRSLAALAQEVPSPVVNSTFVSHEDRLAIAKSLASASLGEWDKSNNALEDVSNSTVRSFWLSVNSFMESGRPPESLSVFEEGGLVHPLAFFKAAVLDPATTSPALWQLSAPSSPAWSMFRKNLMEMKPKAALETIDRESGSLLLSSDLVSALQNYRLAFALLTGDVALAENVWKKLDTESLPMSLRVAAAIVFKLPFSRVLNNADYGHNDHLFILSGLCEAAGIEYFSNFQPPFWDHFSGKELNQKINSYPLDRLLSFTDLSVAGSKGMNKNIARRTAFLFPSSELGAESLIYLADNAAGNRDFKLSAFYLKRVNQDKFGPHIRMQWLTAAVEYDLAVGNDAKAMKAYNEILNSGGSLPPEKELKLALLIQQKGELKKAQAILERIWSDRDLLKDKELEAEILFWIAEGEHAMGDKDKALRNYLELAWKYPEQNIWAVTAMYRASMIYELKGQFETAKLFLKTVIKRADREAQKEAAKTRLNAIESELAKVTPGKDTSFPF